MFGSFPCPWAGGRTNSGYVSAPQMYDTIQKFNTYGVSVRHTFNNVLLNKTHLGDITGNAICKLTSKASSEVANGCTVNSADLVNYIKKTYPKLYVVWSTTKELSDVDAINELSKGQLTVISYTYNNDFDRLKQLKHSENIEILCVEEGCIPNCPTRNARQTYVSKYNLLDFNPGTQFFPPPCLSHTSGSTYFYSHIYNRSWYISIDDIREKYLPLGFNKFKISGRSNNPLTVINSIENYVLYLVKPEYRDRVRNVLLINYFSPTVPEDF